MDELEEAQEMGQWETRMEAVVNGAVDYDDATEFVMECAIAADYQLKKDGALVVAPLRIWRAIAERTWDTCVEKSDPECVEAFTLVRMACQADLWEQIRKARDQRAV